MTGHRCITVQLPLPNWSQNQNSSGSPTTVLSVQTSIFGTACIQKKTFKTSLSTGGGADTNPEKFSTILQYMSWKNRLIDREVELDTNATSMNITLTHDSPMYHGWHREMWQHSVSVGNPWVDPRWISSEILKGSNKEGIAGYKEQIERKGNYTRWEKLSEAKGRKKNFDVWDTQKRG